MERISCFQQNKFAVLFSLMAVFLFPFCSKAVAQDSLRSVKLSEVKVEGMRMIHHTDHDSYMPTKFQREHASNGLDLLSQMHLPGLRIDQVDKSVSYTHGTGSVMVRINDVESTIEDLLAIPPSQLIRVEYTSAPGMKYGQGVAVVLNVRTRCEDMGMAFGVNTMNALSTDYNDDGTWLKLFRGKSEFSLLYDFKMNDISKVFTNMDETFRYLDGKTKTLHTDGEYSGGKYRLDDFTLSYNYTKPERRVLDVKGMFSWNRFPKRHIDEKVTGDDEYMMQTSNQSDEKQSMIKVYYGEDFSKYDAMTVNMAFGYLYNTYNRGFVSPRISSLYDVNGKKYSLKADIDYTHQFSKSQSLSFGYQQTGAYTSNQYLDRETTQVNMNDNSQYLFAEEKGSLGGFSFLAGIGVSRQSFSQSMARYAFYSWRPNLSVQYNIGPAWQVSYRYSRSSELPSLAELTDYPRQDDDYQVTVGNPNLKPYNKDLNLFVMDYQHKSTEAFFYALYEYSKNSISNNPVEEKDGLFWNTMGNKTNLQHFEFAFNLSQELFNRRLSVYVEPNFRYYRVTGMMHYTNSIVSVQTGCDAYIKRFSASFYYRSPIETLEGDLLEHRYATSDFNVAYQYHSFSVKVGWRNAVSPKGKLTKLRRLSDTISSAEVTGNSGFGNMVYLSLSWNILKGHQHKVRRAEDINASLDDGIVK